MLEFDDDVFEHVAEPGPFVLGHPADEPAGLAVRAPVLLQAGEPLHEGVHEVLPDPHRRPFLQHAEVDHLPDDGEVGVDVGADIDVRGADVHGDRGQRAENRRQIVGAALVVALVRAGGGAGAGTTYAPAVAVREVAS